jgi:NADH:ubiquinone oxidoreductase subunit F (NADH-binding)
VRSATAAETATDRYHLLGHPADLEGHLRALGPLSLPAGRDEGWEGWLLAALKSSGLKGRGGAAFPTAVKLGVARAGHGRGVVVVNGMEGEPASDKDKVLLTRAPHLVLDGAQALAAACGADRVVVCIPIDRDSVAEAVRVAMAERAGLSCARVAESVVRPPARFVAGEESALTRWIDGGISRPMFRPDKSVPLRIGKRPVLVHNAETLAHVALIARGGGDAFRSLGLAEEPGTTLVTVSGAVTRPGVVEIERGTPLRDVVARSIPTERIAALLVGGYGGTWVGPAHFGLPYASISLRTIGAAAGVGVIVVLGGRACGLSESARMACYLAGQSSGQCGPCVHGLPAIADDMTRLAEGRADPDLRPRLERRLDQVEGGGACRHPDGAVGMVRSALRVFADDTAAHERGEPCAHVHVPTQLRFPSEARE